VVLDLFAKEFQTSVDGIHMVHSKMGSHSWKIEVKMDKINISAVSQSRNQFSLPASGPAMSVAKTNAAHSSQETSAQFAQISNVNKQSLETLLNNSKELDHALEKLTQLADNSGRALGFSKDQAVSGPVITVTDKDTGEVVRQIPTEVVVRVAHSIEKMKGLLFDQSF
jgi:flagellar protein FlaG